MRTGNATKLQNFWQIFWNSMCYFVCIYAHMNICIIYACVCIINFALSRVKFWLCHWCEDRFNLIWLSGLHWCWCKKKNLKHVPWSISLLVFQNSFSRKFLFARMKVYPWLHLPAIVMFLPWILIMRELL